MAINFQNINNNKPTFNDKKHSPKNKPAFQAVVDVKIADEFIKTIPDVKKVSDGMSNMSTTIKKVENFFKKNISKERGNFFTRLFKKPAFYIEGPRYKQFFETKDAPTEIYNKFTRSTSTITNLDKNIEDLEKQEPPFTTIQVFSKKEKKQYKRINKNMHEIDKSIKDKYPKEFYSNIGHFQPMPNGTSLYSQLSDIMATNILQHEARRNEEILNKINEEIVGNKEVPTIIINNAEDLEKAGPLLKKMLK